MTSAFHFPARLAPKLPEALRGYGRAALVSDIVAGLTVGIVALPLAMAFAISSGVAPESGIYTAIIAGIVVSALGGSRCQVAGPTGAFVVVVADIVTRFGMSGLLMCTMMAGAILILMGLTGLGAAVRYIPRAVTIGFTNGIAVLIASTQLKDFCGLAIEDVPGEFVDRMKALAAHARTAKPADMGVGGAALGIVLLWPRVTKKVPGSIVALLATTVACALIGLNVATIGSTFGGLPSGLPAFELPEFRADLIVPLLPSALTVALLAAIESLLSAVVADNMAGDKHRPDAELVAQGLANLAAPVVGGIPATGAIARTATNIRSGGRTPVSGIVHGLTLLAVLLAAAPLARFIPLATLAAVLLVVAYNMGEWREIPSILRLTAADRLVWVATFALTVLADLTIAVQVGMVLAALLYIRRVTETTTVVPITDDHLRDGESHALPGKQIPGHVAVIRIHGPFLFGATGKLEGAIEHLDGTTSVVILKLSHMTALDGTGLHALEMFAERMLKAGRTLLLCGAREQPCEIIRRSRLSCLIGRENILPHIDAALQRSAELGPPG